MFYLLFCLLVIAVSMVLFRKYSVANPFSKGVALAIAFSVVAAVCLAQNFTQSLIPGASDGIGISNRVAYWIIGEDGWSIETFRAYFERSIFIALFFIAAYPAFLIAESGKPPHPSISFSAATQTTIPAMHSSLSGDFDSR